MRPDGNPLDLNNLPDDYSSRDHGKQVLENTSSTGFNEKQGGEDDTPSGHIYKQQYLFRFIEQLMYLVYIIDQIHELLNEPKKVFLLINVSGGSRKDECGKVYECRFCSLKFCKSQALGGHMNRHRQEKETEKLNNARQLLLRNDHNNLAAQAALHLGCSPPIATAAYHPSAGNMGDRTMPLRFPLTFSGSSSSTHIPPSQPPPLYASPSHHPVSFPTHIIPHQHLSHQYNMSYVAGAAAADSSSNYTCIGAPVGQLQGFPGRHKHNIGEEFGFNWGRSYSEAQQHHLDPPSPIINQFQADG